MGAIGRTNSGSGGGVSPNKITIHVNASLGCNIDFSLNSSIVKTIPANKAIPNSDGKTADYYYSTTATGTYTVTATIDGISTSKTVTVSATKQYDVTIRLVVIYNLGNEYTSLTGGLEKIKGINNDGYSVGTMTKNSDNIYLNATSAHAVGAITVNTISLKGCTTLNIDTTSAGGSQGPRLVWSTSHNSPMDTGQQLANIQFTGSGVHSMDISSVNTTLAYVCVRALATTGNSSNVTFTKIWAEG